MKAALANARGALWAESRNHFDDKLIGMLLRSTAVRRAVAQILKVGPASSAPPVRNAALDASGRASPRNGIVTGPR